MAFSSEQRRYLLVGCCLVPAVANAIINGLIAWVAFAGPNPVPMWRLGTSVGVDTLATCLLLPAITCLIVTRTVHKDRRSGKIAPVQGPRWLRLLRYSGLARAAVLGSLGFGVGLLGLAALMLSGIAMLEPTPLIVGKVVYTTIMGATVTPLIAVLALSDREISIGIAR